MRLRAKCIRTRAYPGAPEDPYLIKGRFYDVIDQEIHTIADSTPFISVKTQGQVIERPRHLFGRVFQDVVEKDR